LLVEISVAYRQDKIMSSRARRLSERWASKSYQFMEKRGNG